MTTLERVRAEIEEYLKAEGFGTEYRADVSRIIDKYAEQEPKVTTTSTDEPMVMQYPQVDGITPTVVKAEQEPTTRQSCENCKQDPKECGNDAHYGFCQNWEKAEQEPCDDVVSRQWLMRKATERFYTTNYFNHITKMIEEAPSVRPQEPTGHWIKQILSVKPFGEDTVLCDQCAFMTDKDSQYNFCPNCGAKMVEPQESEEV